MPMFQLTPAEESESDAGLRLKGVLCAPPAAALRRCLSLPPQLLASAPHFLAAVLQPPARGAREPSLQPPSGGGGGDCGQGASSPIAKNCGKLRGNCGAVTKPRKVSRSTLLHRGHTGHQQAGKADNQKVIAEKLRKIAEICGELRNCEKLQPSIPPPCLPPP